VKHRTSRSTIPDYPNISLTILLLPFLMTSPMADASKAGQMGSPMPGLVEKLLVAEGQVSQTVSHVTVTTTNHILLSLFIRIIGFTHVVNYFRRSHRETHCVPSRP